MPLRGDKNKTQRNKIKRLSFRLPPQRRPIGCQVSRSRCPKPGTLLYVFILCAGQVRERPDGRGIIRRCGAAFFAYFLSL
jgi:hypothetical protein